MDVLLSVAAKLGTPTFGAKSEGESLRAASADPDPPLGVQHQDGPEWVKLDGSRLALKVRLLAVTCPSLCG
jgi:hypothetical protein